MALLSSEEREALMNDDSIWEGFVEEGADSQPASSDSVSEKDEQQAQDSSLTTDDKTKTKGADAVSVTTDKATPETSETTTATASDTAADGAGDDAVNAQADTSGTTKEGWVPRTRLQSVIKQRNDRDTKIRELELKLAQYEERNRATSETVKYFQNERAVKLANGGTDTDDGDDLYAALERIVNGGGQTKSAQQNQAPQPSRNQQTQTGTHIDPVQQAVANLEKKFNDRLAAIEQRRLDEIATQRLAQETRQVAEQFEFFKDDVNLQKLRAMHYVVHQNYKPKDENDPGPSLVQVAQMYLKDIEDTAKRLGYTKQQAQEAETAANKDEQKQGKPSVAANAGAKKDAPPRNGSSVGATSQPKVPEFEKSGTWKDQARNHAMKLDLSQFGF